MEPSTFLSVTIGIINLILAIVFIYYASKNAVKLKGAVIQYLMAMGALFFVICGVSSVITFLVFDTSFIAGYIMFIVGFLLILMGEIYSDIIIQKVVGKKSWLMMARTFSYSRYRFSGILAILLFATPFWTLNIMTRSASIYGTVASFFILLSFILLVMGERKLYVTTKVFLDTRTIADGKEINLFRDDIAAVRIYTDIINTFLSSDKPMISAKIVNNTLSKWSEEHPVLFENCLMVGEYKIDVGVVIQNLNRIYEKARLSITLKEFSVLTDHLVDLYGGLTSPKYVKERLAESYKAVKKQYSDAPIIFDILRTMPAGILENEKLTVLSRDELEAKVKERSEELIKINKELQIEIEERKRAEKLIRTSLKEKEILLKEIHHRVKNNLQVISSLLSLQSKTIKDGQALEKFKESQNRVKLMALFHEKLYQPKNLAEIDFGEYIRSIVTNLFHSYGSNPDVIALQTDINDTSLLDVDTAIPCGLIINELVSNSLKHAFTAGRKGKVCIDFRLENDNKFMLTVSDNGVGMLDDLDFRNTKSLGLQLVNTLVEQLEGTIDLDRNGGTAFKIKFAKAEIE